MISLRRSTCALFLATLILCPAIARGQVFEGRQLVEAKLLADTATVVPGQPFTAGLLLKMAPGWHTYWKFSGDAGIPTEISELAARLEAEPIQWPIPPQAERAGESKFMATTTRFCSWSRSRRAENRRSSVN